MAITKYARTVHTGSDPQRQPGQPEAAHGSPPHPAVMNSCFSTTDYSLLRLMMQKAQVTKTATSPREVEEVAQQYKKEKHNTHHHHHHHAANSNTQ